MAEQSRSQLPAGAPRAPANWNGTPRYEVLGCLGQGGMGIVYEAFDRLRRERIALKTVLHFDPGSLYRFKQEFRALADVRHPNLVHLYELVAGECDDVLFTMELVEGTDFLEHVRKPGLSRRIDQSDVATESTTRKAYKVRERASLPVDSDARHRATSQADFDKLRPALRQLVDGVRALHAAGKLHRDLKPSNVRVTSEGRVVILDFGVATELRRSARASHGDDEVVGTASYMAPEQASTGVPVAASDWYSVGALLYEAMVGRPPFSGSAADVLTVKQTVTPMPPSTCVEGVPPDLDALCMSLLAPDPALRPGPAEIVRGLGATPSEPAPPVTDVTRLFGREAHLRALHEAFDATHGKLGTASAVRVGGPSGLGKSALAHHFLDELEERGDVLVLRGRAYERESVPFKAVDSVVDALCRHLLTLGARGEAPALPSDVSVLAHVFPVLRRVESIDEVPQASVGDPQVLRQRAFRVLRELFASLATRQKIVVFIDDVQWGDDDSAALLVELMRPPAPPPILLLMTHRAEDVDKSPFLVNLRARWSEDTLMHEVTVGPLDGDDARRLALALLGASDPWAHEAAEAIARESAGNPFLVEELARSASEQRRGTAEGPSMPFAVTLDQVLTHRVGQLSADARRLLEVVAIGARPLPVSTVAAATGMSSSAAQLVALLRSRRFVRTGLRNGIEVVEAIHDRVREALVAQLDAPIARGYHAELARVLEATPDSDPEAIATHLLGAGDPRRAGHYAERAAEQAIAKLAFAQAARLFEFAVDTLPPASPDARRLWRRVAEASEWAGLAEKAARAYLTAGVGAAPLERVDLERYAASQLVAAGCVDEGAEIFRRVLAAVGRPIPGSVLRVLIGTLVYRAAAGWHGTPEIDDAKTLDPEEQVRLDALLAATRALTVVDPISAMYVKARYLSDALSSGARFHVVHAAVSEAGTLASRGGSQGKRERRLLEMARELCEGHEEAHALYQVTYGISQYVRGHWREALETLDVARAHLASQRRWNANAHVYAAYALAYLGDLPELKARTLALLADAEQRGDRYTAVNLRASHPVAAWIASDDLDRARRHVRESMAEWSKTRFLVQHWQAMLWETECDLYARDGAGAWERLERDADRLRRSRLDSVQLIRAFTSFARGRSAVASLAVLSPSEARRRLRIAVRETRRLEGEAMVWTAPLAAMLGASVARARRDTAGAELALRRAISLADAAEMSLYAASARLQLGMLCGASGAAMVGEAEDAMRTRGVRAPARYAQMLMP